MQTSTSNTVTRAISGVTLNLTGTLVAEVKRTGSDALVMRAAGTLAVSAVETVIGSSRFSPPPYWPPYPPGAAVNATNWWSRSVAAVISAASDGARELPVTWSP